MTNQAPVQQNPIDPNIQIPLTLPVGAINIIMQALTKLPYEQAAPLLDELRTQATIALAKAAAAPAEDDVTQTLTESTIGE